MEGCRITFDTVHLQSSTNTHYPAADDSAPTQSSGYTSCPPSWCGGQGEDIGTSSGAGLKPTPTVRFRILSASHKEPGRRPRLEQNTATATHVAVRVSRSALIAFPDTIGFPTKSLAADHGWNRTLPLLRTLRCAFRVPLSSLRTSARQGENGEQLYLVRRAFQS